MPATSTNVAINLCSTVALVVFRIHTAWEKDEEKKTAKASSLGGIWLGLRKTRRSILAQNRDGCEGCTEKAFDFTRSRTKSTTRGST